MECIVCGTYVASLEHASPRGLHVLSSTTYVQVVGCVLRARSNRERLGSRPSTVTYVGIRVRGVLL
jgi:hypothetical protein